MKYHDTPGLSLLLVTFWSHSMEPYIRPPRSRRLTSFFAKTADLGDKNEGIHPPRTTSLAPSNGGAGPRRGSTPGPHPASAPTQQGNPVPLVPMCHVQRSRPRLHRTSSSRLLIPCSSNQLRYFSAIREAFARLFSRATRREGNEENGTRRSGH